MCFETRPNAKPKTENGTALLLEQNENLGTKQYFEGIYEANLPVIVFGTDDIQADYERLKTKSVEFRGEPKKTEWGTQVVFDDICGNLIQLPQV